MHDAKGNRSKDKRFEMVFEVIEVFSIGQVSLNPLNPRGALFQEKSTYITLSIDLEKKKKRLWSLPCLPPSFPLADKSAVCDKEGQFLTQ
ncbi:hypothetical protein NPIL_211631 [Nephila pilipes]|uniref:Uncharacterized protein n=1 Tax=Nephila pilipes TaxID=299642 RepID=A0A8X6IT01_NEPPI|nr:hypothetical protein NPIL_211631 [Nephila pilipes]